MKEFQVGDRVRVRATPQTGSHADKTGEVVMINYKRRGAVSSCLVLLDGNRTGNWSDIHIAYLLDELEPEVSDPPQRPDDVRPARAQSMTEFKAGDRVRVRNVRSVGPYAGRAGEILWVARQYPGGPPLSYVVRIDVDSVHPVPPAHAVVASQDLETEERSG